MYLIGYDIGSSSIKAALVDAGTRQTVVVVQSPAQEMDILSAQPGWAEQHPDTWWKHVCEATRQLLKQTGIAPEKIKGVGIAYQMHGLVMVDKNHQPLRPSIIWCDSRAVEIGNRAFQEIGPEKCLTHLLNSPGNFTASKLKWVQDHEPEVYEKAWKVMLPGDYIALKLTGEARTTPGGLSEGILWDFTKNDIAELILDHYKIDRGLLPEVTAACSHQGKLSRAAAAATGLKAGTPVTYRAGDQPNNAMSLNVLNPGEIAATGGTSGVVYGVVDAAVSDPQSRVNCFAYMNHSAAFPRIGILLCINGAGIQYSWARQHLAGGTISYGDMEKMAASIPVGSDGLCILPFGNGAERMLGNLETGSRICNLHFNRHTQAHFFRAALEGIAFSFVYGMGILNEMGLNVSVMRVGNDNLFRSAIFSNTIASLEGCQIQVLETTGAAGAAKAAGVAVGLYGSLDEAVKGGKVVMKYEPSKRKNAYTDAFAGWMKDLEILFH
jgi:xylulokinase